MDNIKVDKKIDPLMEDLKKDILNDVKDKLPLKKNTEEDQRNPNGYDRRLQEDEKFEGEDRRKETRREGDVDAILLAKDNEHVWWRLVFIGVSILGFLIFLVEYTRNINGNF